MTDAEVIQRLALVRQRRWPRTLFLEWYGVDLWEDPSLKAQFKIWAARLPKGEGVVGDNDVDRWTFELFCQDRECVPISEAAAQFAMSTKDFESVLVAMSDAQFIEPLPEKGKVPRVCPESLLRILPKLLPTFSRKTYASQSSYTLEFHAAISRDLPELQIKLLRCVASELFNEDPVETASERDIITLEPIGLGYQIWLEFNKPLSLKPDACSVKTYAQFDSLLKDVAMGGPGFSEIDVAKRLI